MADGAAAQPEDRSRPPHVAATVATAATAAAPIRAVSWNIHRGRGADGLVNPGRILRTLAEEVCPPGSAHVLGLQEADEERPPHGGILDIAAVEQATGLRYAHRDPRLRWGSLSHGFLGSILFLPPEREILHADVVGLPGRCQRGAVAIELGRPGPLLRVICTHLSLAQTLRIAQMRVIGQYVFRRPAMPTVLLGDLNEWRPWGGLAFSAAVTGLHMRGPRAASFPVSRPLLSLDRILCDVPNAVRRLEVLDGPGIRTASDHRPVRAELAL